jgi:hypothetical protein
MIFLYLCYHKQIYIWSVLGSWHRAPIIPGDSNVTNNPFSNIHELILMRWPLVGPRTASVWGLDFRKIMYVATFSPTPGLWAEDRELRLSSITIISDLIIPK